jgi:hypothetical protein
MLSREGLHCNATLSAGSSFIFHSITLCPVTGENSLAGGRRPKSVSFDRLCRRSGRQSPALQHGGPNSIPG